MGLRLLRFGVFSLFGALTVIAGSIHYGGIANAEEVATYELGGTASLAQPGLSDSMYAVKTTADSTNRGGDLYFAKLRGTKFSSLHTLSTDYKVTVGDCRGESPRFYAALDRNNDRRTDGYVYFIISPEGTPCGNSEQNSGNVAESTDKVKSYGLPWSSLTNTMTQAQARYGNYTITGIGLVGDDIYAQPNGQTILFDNVTINNDLYDFEPADTTPPSADITSPSEGSTIYGDLVVKGSVNDDYKLQGYNLSVMNSEGDVVAGTGMVSASGSIIDSELYNFDTTSLPDGNYSIHLEAYDTADNKGPESTDVVNITVNNVPDSKEQCKDNSYTLYPSNFKNQGACIASVQGKELNPLEKMLKVINKIIE